jgi:Icc protein
MTSTLIVQISDCHLAADPGQGYRGINSHDNLKTLLEKLRLIKPDLILASGDLSEDGSRISYEMLREYLAPLHTPVLALPGNHDDAGLLAEVFPGSPVDTIAVSKHGPWYMVRLNSALPGKPEGHLGEKTLSDLEAFLQGHAQYPVLVALHHQPVLTDSPWIDRYRLLEPDRLLSLIDQYTNIKAVAWGHVHMVYANDRNGTAMLGSPSSAINARSGVQKFTADTLGPACRWLQLNADGSFTTDIIKLTAASIRNG